MSDRQSECPSRELLIAFLSHEPNAEPHAWIKAHLETCLECQQVKQTHGALNSPTFSLVTQDHQPLTLNRVDSIGEHQSNLESLNKRNSIDTPTLTQAEITNLDVAVPLAEVVEGVPGAGRTLGRYQILQQFNDGAMGSVYKVHDPKLNKTLVLKMISSRLNPRPYQELFQQEIQSLARLKHDHIVRILHCDEINGEPFFTMEFACQGSLLQNIYRFRHNARAMAQLMATVARALQYVHDQDFIHRDLKPANILLDSNDKPLISDFGLVIPEGSKTRNLPQKPVGTVPYMAPEQILGSQKLTTQADIWALGVILYEVLTGKRPFQSPERLADRDKEREVYKDLICFAHPIRPRKLVPQLHRHLELIILRCLEKNPDSRYRSAAALADDLEGWLEGEAPKGHRHPIWIQSCRWIQGHPVTITTMAALLMLAAGILVTRELNDPLRVVRQMNAELKVGKTVNLLEGIRPRYVGWPIGEGQLQKNSKDLDFVTFYSKRIGLLEILPETTIRSYRLVGKIRHEVGNQGHTGLAVCLGRYPTPEGPIIAFFQVSFNDLKKERDKEDPNPIWTMLHTLRNYDAIHNLNRISSSLGLINELTLEPAQIKESQGPWREFELVVTADQIHITYEKRTAVINSKEEILSFIQDKLDLEKGTTLQTKIQLGSGIGLFCMDAQGSFKDLTIESLELDR